MGLEKGKKLNQLLSKWPPGAVYLSSWLKKEGIGYDLLRKYRNSGWLEAIGNGAVVRSGDEFDWLGGIYALQMQGRLDVHVGGKTALQLQGYGHFLPLGKGGLVSLYGPTREKLPKWFKDRDWGYRLNHYQTALFPQGLKLGLTQKNQGAFAVTISAPERAIMEYLYLVPQEESFDEGVLLMEGLTSLRPKLVQELLERCNSNKVNRLFLYLAERCGHSWFKKLDIKRVKLGSGKKQIVKGGHLDPKYQITVKEPSHEG